MPFAINTLEKNILMFIQRERGNVTVDAISDYIKEGEYITIGVLKIMEKKKLLTIDFENRAVQMDYGIYAKLWQKRN